MSQPKLHHYVPRMLLRRFSGDPAAENGPLEVLDKATHGTRRSSVANEAAVTHYNRLEELPKINPEIDPLLVETAFSMVEDSGDQAIRRLVLGEPLTPMRRLEMAFLVYFQHHRTPRGRSWSKFMQEQTQTMWMMRQLLDQDLVVDHLRGIGEDVTAEEAREWAQKQIRDLEDGTVWVDAGHDREVGGMFMFAEKIVPIIAGAMDWFVMHTAIGVSRRFIIGDHPVAMVDETVPKTHGVGWMGSPDVEVTLPLSPTCCLVLRPAPPGQDGRLEHVDAFAADVDDVNLRTFASAEWSAYGPDVESLKRVAALARANRDRVRLYAPHSPVLHIAEITQGETNPSKIDRLRPSGNVPRGRRKATGG